MMKNHRFVKSVGMDEPVFSRLRGLSILWNQLAGDSEPSFFEEFFRELRAINQFQFDFPGTPPVHLIGMLRINVLNRLNGKRPETGGDVPSAGVGAFN